jgi:hypothetical protein
MVLIDSPSAQALAVQPQYAGSELGQATGFVVMSAAGPLLITNWHVVTGRNQETRKPIRLDAAIPDQLLVRHNRKDQLGNFIQHVEPLYDSDGHPRWLEHPRFRLTVDVVALPLTKLDDVQLVPFDHSEEVGHDTLPDRIKWGASDGVFILGFPFGWKGSGDLAIWVHGVVATEPELDFRNLPRFLVDSRTRKGQSGAPVVYYNRGGGFVQLKDGRPYMLHNPRTILLGVYSGRLSEESDLGTVWKSSLIQEIASHGVPGEDPNS